MLDKSGIYPGFIWDISGIYPGFIYIPDKSRIYPKYIPEYIPNISGIYTQIYLEFQGWGVEICIEYAHAKFHFFLPTFWTGQVMAQMAPNGSGCGMLKSPVL
jgi:hypothetical protein